MIADTCGCVSDAAAGEQTQESEEATAAAAEVRSHSFIICIIKTVNYTEMQLTSLSALQESKTEDGGESAGESWAFLLQHLNVKHKNIWLSRCLAEKCWKWDFYFDTALTLSFIRLNSSV